MRRPRLAVITRAIAIAAVLSASGGCGYDSAEVVRSAAGPASRDKLSWPFAATSIWNTPIGSQARLLPAGIRAVEGFWPHVVFVVRTSAGDPERTLFAPMRPGDPCGGSTMLGSLPFPDDFVLSASDNQNPGNSTSVLLPDGRTLFEISGLARCQPGGPVFGFAYGQEDIRGEGLIGGQGGSGMSAIGGALRAGELFGTAPIRHALKLNLWANRYYFGDPTDPTRCRRWPATRCDAGFANPAPDGYHGSNPALVMGTLLTLPKDTSAPALGLESAPGALIFAAMRDYGGYVVGDAGKDLVQLALEAAAIDEMDRLMTPALRAAFERDLNRILPALHIVDNNGPGSVGGGGAPLAPTAPPFSN